MGQGYSLTTLSAASASIDVPELADLQHEKTLASARFMKSIRARNQQGIVFVKAVMKPYSSFEVQKYVKLITEERDAIADVPNALGYQRIVEVGTGGFLVRQYIYSSLYDRMSTRPFLEDIEKKWMAFQLLCAVRECHARNVFHGDIKTENLLVTSWNWLYLTDFSSSFKPANLPEDNPADFSFYFDTSGRRTCYLAPERFTATSMGDMQGEVNWAMDIFSVGCVIAEVFLEGPIFSLSQIFKYRAGDYSPKHTHLNKIEDPEVREMILNMIELDPEKRYSAEQYLTFYRSKIFPEYFYSFLHQYMLDLTDPSSGRKPVTLDLGNLGESDDKIDRVYHDFDKISYFLGYKTNHSNARSQRSQSISYPSSTPKRSERGETDSTLYDGTLIFLTLVASSMRNTAKASARLKACDLLVSFAERLPDEAKLDRILPYIAGLLNDSSDTVKVAALRSMTSILNMVQVVSPINAYIFPEYIFPRLKHFVLSPTSSPSALVRAAYATCLAPLALSSSRILDMVQAIRADGRLPALADSDWSPESSYHGLYDFSRIELVRHFEEATKSLITDPDTSVRRAFLGSVSRLCVFFGSTKASDVILSHLNTYLNDKDWILKCSFYDALVGVGAYVGSVSLERFILPIMIQSLTDPEGFVVEKVFRTLARMAALGLLQKSTSWELISIAVRFLIHPSIWIRESAVQFIVLSTRYISPADKYCIVMPLIHPFLKVPIADITEEKILNCLKKPFPKPAFDMAITWAGSAEKSLFWNAASRDATFSLPDPDSPTSPSLLTRRLITRIPPSQRNADDQRMLDKLRGLGMASEDEMKLVALREYILKISSHKINGSVSDRRKMLANVISLNQISVTPQNVFFDNREPVREVKDKNGEYQSQRRDDEPHTIADALLDASTTIEEYSRRSDSQSRQLVQNDGSPTPPKSIPNAPSTDIVGEPSKASPTTTATVPAINIKTVSDRQTGGGFPGGEPSSSTSDKLHLQKTSSFSSSVGLRHRNSAIHLMNKNDASNKADAAIATSEENAFGKLDGPMNSRRLTEPSPLSLAAEGTGKSLAKSPLSQSSQPMYEPNHSYTGTDPNVLRLLDNHFVENFPTDILDFGQIRPPFDTKSPIRRASDASALQGSPVSTDTVTYHSEPWRPSGHLLTLFSEHISAVNRVVAAPDHAFFVTASDDGTCKVWDTTRLEKNITPRSRHTHRHAQGSKVKSLCFVDNTHAFVSGADDGSIHIVKVDHKSIEGGESTRYGKPILVRDYQIPPDPAPDAGSGKAADGLSNFQTQEHAIWLHHYRTHTTQSILLIATNKCRILALDLKVMDILYTMNNPIHHGTPTTFCVDKKYHWLLLGTSHGVLDLWDLRFRLRLRSFGIQSTARIDRLLVHPTRGRGKWVFISSGGEISVWDIEKMVCRDVYRPSSFVHPDGANAKPYEAWFPDDEPTEKILARFVKDIQRDESRLEPQMTAEAASSPSTPTRNSSQLSNPYFKAPLAPILTMRALHLSADLIHNTSNPQDPTKASFLLSGGGDRTLRYWDISRPELSAIVSGFPPGLDEGLSGSKAKYEISHPLSVSAGGGIMVVQEIFPDSGGGERDRIVGAGGSSNKGGGSAKSTPSKRSTRTGTTPGTPGTPREAITTRDGVTSSPGSAAAAAAAGTPRSITGTTTSTSSSNQAKPPRNTLISVHQQQLLRTHLDEVLDVCLLRRPYGCVVSVDRGGGVYVFQ